MGLLSRTIFREVVSSALLGTMLFTFVLFLQKLGKLFEILVRSSAPLPTVGYLFALVLPPTLTFAVPVGALVGVLVGLNRMSSDGEIIAMRAGGIPGRKTLPPVLAFALLATGVAAAATLWLTPLSIRETYRLLNRLAAEQLTAEIQPRIFEESFPNAVLYVGDVIPGPVVQWRNIFMADMTPPEERQSDAREYGESPRITIAAQAIAVPDLAANRIQLSLTGASSHDVGRNPDDYYITAFPQGEQALDASERDERQARGYTAMDTRPLWKEAAHSYEAAIELHQRLALPLACILLALVGVPLGVSSRKAGKSAAIVVTVSLAFLYYMALISLIGMARQGQLPVELAVWAPNAVLAIAAVILMLRLEKPGERDFLGRVRALPQTFIGVFRKRLPKPQPGLVSTNGRRLGKPLLFPLLVDTYVLGSFMFYFFLLLASFVGMAHVFTFFELLGDIVKNSIPFGRVLTYHLFLTPKLIYDSAPLSVLVAVLVTFGLLSKSNEVTAMKACGVSLYRLSVPILMMSGLLSVALFAFDHYHVPEANRVQDAIRNEIKGRPVQTYLRPDRKWIFGTGPRIYYYKYFEPAERLMVGINVYELDSETFRLKRHIAAERARWEPSLKTWVFQNGWVRDIEGVRVTRHESFQGQPKTFPQLTEEPGYFLKEVKQDKQMNYQELANYIRELRQSGFDTVRLQVQFHKKFSVPLFALIMAVISAPFAFLTGSRGAMAGVGVSFGLAIAYWAVSQLFEQVGNLNQLPPVMAAWAPDAVFLLAGVSLFTRLRT